MSENVNTPENVDMLGDVEIERRYAAINGAVSAGLLSGLTGGALFMARVLLLIGFMLIN